MDKHKQDESPSVRGYNKILQQLNIKDTFVDHIRVSFIHTHLNGVGFYQVHVNKSFKGSSKNVYSLN